MFTWNEWEEMDERGRVFWIRAGDRLRRERMRDLMYAVRVGFNAEGAEFTRITHELLDERSAEEKAQEEWDFLKMVGGG